jgi:hypothetical protein
MKGIDLHRDFCPRGWKGSLIMAKDWEITSNRCKFELSYMVVYSKKISCASILGFAG